MRFLHLSDLHLGKRVNEYSMIDDQKYILEKIYEICDKEKPDAVLIAGDIYDKQIPPVEAVNLFDDFLVTMSKKDLSLFILSGNHDSAERLAFAHRLMVENKVYLSAVYDGTVKSHTLTDEYGDVCIYMLPFIKPAHVRRYYPDAKIETYTDAIHTALSDIQLDDTKRNILMTHQFVTGGLTSESEESPIGGLDNVDSYVFDSFDYVALGHLHRPQHIGRETVRYSGTPLKYSFSEVGHNKSVTILDMQKKGDISIDTHALVPLHDMVHITGTFKQLTDPSYYKGTTWCTDYLRITLTDQDEIFDAIGKLRRIYHNIMRLDYDNKRTRNYAMTESTKSDDKTPLEMFCELYEKQNNTAMDDERFKLAKSIMEKVWEVQQ